MAEKGRWAPPVPEIETNAETGRLSIAAGEFEFVRFDPERDYGNEGFVFRFIDRGFYPKMGWLMADGSWVCLERLETDEVVATYAMGKMGIGLTFAEEGVVTASAAVGLPETNQFASRDLVFAVDNTGKMFSYVQLWYPDGTRWTMWEAEHKFGKKNAFIVVSDEIDRLANGGEILSTYVRQQEIDRSPAMFSYHAGIKRHPNQIFEFWVTRLLKSISWRLPWQIEWKDEILWQLHELPLKDFLPALNRLTYRLGRMGMDRPIARNLKTEGG